MQHAHPAAPEELKKSFADFLKKFQSPVRTNGNESSPGVHTYQEYWEAPSKYWNSRVKKISEEEIDAVLVSVHLLPMPLSCSQVLSRAGERRYIRLHIQFPRTKIRFFNLFPRTRASVSQPLFHPSPATVPSVQLPHLRFLKQSQSRLLPA